MDTSSRWWVSPPWVRNSARECPELFLREKETDVYPLSWRYLVSAAGPDDQLAERHTVLQYRRVWRLSDSKKLTSTTARMDNGSFTLEL